MNNSFNGRHPVVNYIFFGMVLICAMCITHPAFIIISFLSATIYYIKLQGIKPMGKMFIGLCFIIFLTIIINGLFNHYGVTNLYRFRNGNYLTLEAIAYGAALGGVFATVILWFGCYNAIMTTDKFLYVFGYGFPTVALIISMALRFVPLYRKKLKNISDGRKAIGKGINQGNVYSRLKNGLGELSILITWAMENAIDTSDSMNSRGYGSGKRTRYNIYNFDISDMLCLLTMLFLMGMVIMGIFAGEANVQYNPSIKFQDISIYSVCIYIAYGLICNIPMIMDTMGDIRWHILKQRI